MKSGNHKPVILSADDEQDAHILLKRALAKIGSDVTLTCCSDGSEVIEYLSGAGKYADREKFPMPDLLLLDLKMPRISGLGALEYIRGQSRFERLPVVIFSSSNHAQDVSRAYALGCDSYMVKPVKFQDLIAVVQEIESTFLRKNSAELTSQPSRAIANPRPEKPGPSRTEQLNSNIPPHSPEMFKLLVEQVKDYAIFMIDREGYILSWNEGARRIKGYEPGEIIGKHFSMFYPRSELEADKPQFELRMAREIGRYEEQGWRIRKDGSRFWANVVITPVHDAEGRLAGYAKVTRDLTQSRLQEESFQRLLDSEERFRLLVEQVKDYAIFILDAKGIVSSWNEGARRIKGYTSDEIIGKHFSIFYTPDAVARDHPSNELAMAIRDGRYEEEGWRVRKDGSRFWANVVITALWDKRGNLTGFAKVTRDLTRRKTEEDALRQKTEALELFAHTLSHDLRAPLRSLASFAEILKCESKELSENEKDLYLEKISRSAQMMNALINDILKVNHLSLAPAPEETVPLREVLDETLAIHEMEIQESHAEIEIKNPLPELRANRTLLMQIFMNLLSNALKFVRKGQKPRIQISSVQKEDSCEIHMKDFGVGIPEQFLDSIFNVFERGAAETDVSGTGIGLTIVKRAAERLGGTVSVQSCEGEGSEFIVTLPLDNSRVQSAIAAD